MAFTFTNTSGAGSQSPQSSLPPLSVKQVNTGTWGSGGNTCVITDPYIHANSDVHVWVTGSVPQADFWAITIAQGSATITSGSGESSTLALAYVVY